MHFDWLDCHQDYPEALPSIGKQGYKVVDLSTGEEGALRGMSLVHEGSYSTKIIVKVSGNRLSVSGNPSAFSRLDNLFGFHSVDDCIAVYNIVLASLGLPAFTKCKNLFHLSGEDGSKATSFSDGCVITRLDITSNKSVGKSNESQYIKALSTQPYKNAVPRLHTNGNTVDWLNKKGSVMQDMYLKAYGKAKQMQELMLFKAIRKFGDGSPEVVYIRSVIDYCRDFGVVRFEQELKAGFLRKHHLSYWGLSDFSVLSDFHESFLNVDAKLQVTAMDMLTISQSLLNAGVVSSVHAANCTAMYAINWSHGSSFDFDKSQVQTHRARLRKIGIDIALPCDLSRFSVVQPFNIREIRVSDLAVPHWYQMPDVSSISIAA